MQILQNGQCFIIPTAVKQHCLVTKQQALLATVLALVVSDVCTLHWYIYINTTCLH